MRLALLFIASLALAQNQATQFEAIPYPSGTRGIVRWYEDRANGSNHLQFRAPSSLAGNHDLDWPTPTSNAIWFTRNGGAAVDNNANFCFDAVNTRLGVSTCSPAYTIDAGTGSIGGGSIRPAADDTYSIATTGSRYTNAFLHRVTLSSGAGQGVASNAVPTADNSFGFGNSTYRWLDGHFGLNSNPLNVYRSTDLSNSLIAYRVTGSASNVWSIGATSGGTFQLIRDAVTLGTWTTAGTYISTSGVRPSTNGLQNSGDASFRWNFTYSNTVVLGTSAGQGVGSSVLPTSDASFSLGSSSYRFTDSHFTASNGVNLWRSTDLANSRIAFNVTGSALNVWNIGASSTGNFTLVRDGSLLTEWTSAGTMVTYNGLRPNNDGFQTLGANSLRWGFAYINNLVLGTGGGQGVSSNLNPDGDATRNLGGGLSNRWTALYGVRALMQSTAFIPANLTLYNSSGQTRLSFFEGGVQGGQFEIYDNTGAIRFSLISDTFTVNANVRVQGGWVPSFTNFYDLGNSTTNWRRVYGQTFYGNGTAGYTGNCATTVVVSGGIVTGCI
jgi:hypothetical protein